MKLSNCFTIQAPLSVDISRVSRNQILKFGERRSSTAATTTTTTTTTSLNTNNTNNGQRKRWTLLHQSFSSQFNSQSQAIKRRNVTLPLIDATTSTSTTNQLPQYDPEDTVTDTTTNNNMIIPLPSSHLPQELSTIFMYGLTLNAGMHKLMMQHVVEFGSSNNDLGGSNGQGAGEGGGNSAFGGDMFGIPTAGMGDGILDNMSSTSGGGGLYGHVIWKPNPQDSDEDLLSLSSSTTTTHPLIGSIGCAAEHVLTLPTTTSMNPSSSQKPQSNNEPNAEDTKDDLPMAVLVKGSFRFVVRDVIQTFPFPIAVVDELLDGDESVISSIDMDQNWERQVQQGQDNDEDFDNDFDDDDDYDMYADLTPSELVPRTLSAMKACIDQKLTKKSKPMSLLEQAILEDSGMAPSDDANTISMEAIEKAQAEEMAAVFDIFTSSLIDIAPMPMERYYAIAMMAAEISGLENPVRAKILATVDGVERLKVVLKELEQKISMVQAKKLTDQITGENDESSKDLKVGEPQLPPWAKSIRKGTKIEYFWNEEFGWCRGTIVEEPMKIVDELIVTVMFEDGETHRLPFRGDEKVRWRPAT